MDRQTKQYSKVKYPGCLMDETMSGEAMVLNVIHKISNKLKFLYQKNDFLTPAALRCLLCKALMQPHFDDVWYPNLNKEIKFKPLKTNVCVFACS